MLSTKVKAGEVSSLSDARFFAGMGVDWLGFNVNPLSDAFVNVELYKSIVGWVAGPKRVIEIPSNVDHHQLEKIISDYVPEFLEVDLNELDNYQYDLPVFARTEIDKIQLEKINSKVEFVILSSSANLLKRGDLIRSIADKAQILLSVRPDFPDLNKILNELPISGIALQGSKEIQTGIKEYDYSELLESLETD